MFADKSLDFSQVRTSDCFGYPSRVDSKEEIILIVSSTNEPHDQDQVPNISAEKLGSFEGQKLNAF
jgi:hypothetical protein